MKPKLKVLILTWECYPVFVGGLGVLVKDLVAELRRQNVEVTLLLPFLPENVPIEGAFSLEKTWRKYLKKSPEIAGLEDFKLEVFEKNKVKYEKSLSWRAIFHRQRIASSVNQIYTNDTPLITRAFAWAVLDWLKTKQKEDYFDCFIGMDWESIPSFLVLKKALPKVPFFFYINSTEHERSLDCAKKSWVEKKIQQLEAKVFRQADHTITVSEITRTVLINHFNVASEKITVVLNDTAFAPSNNIYRLPSKNKYVLYLGRLSQQKGLRFLIDTAQKVVEIDPNIHFLIAGDGEILPDVMTHVVEQQLEKNVHFLCWTNYEQKRVLYNTSDLFVMPSPSEPFGLTALEAIKSGVPVIASTNCGFVDLVKSTPTFTYHDTQTFTHLILSLLHNPQELKALVIRQQNDLANHSWSREVAKLVALIELFKAS